MTKTDDEWMREALAEAERAMGNGELPIAAILVAGDEELGRAQTAVTRMGTLAAHAELLTVLHAKDQLWTPARPLKIITSLEPCLMCFGAAIQVGVDEIVFGMRAAPDGAASNFKQIANSGTRPAIYGGLREQEQLALMKTLLVRNPSHRASNYVRAMVAAYDRA